MTAGDMNRLPRPTLPNTYVEKGGFGGGRTRSLTLSEHEQLTRRRRWWQTWRRR